MRFPSSFRVLPTATLLLALLGTSLAGCAEDDPCAGVNCGGCPPALTVMVTDASTGGPVPNVTVVGPDPYVSCAVDVTHTECQTSTMSGVYAFELTAPGYAALQVEETIEEDTGEGCCRCGYVAETIAVTMIPVP